MSSFKPSSKRSYTNKKHSLKEVSPIRVYFIVLYLESDLKKNYVKQKNKLEIMEASQRDKETEASDERIQ